MVLEVNKIGNLYGFSGGNYAGCVYDVNGLSPTIRTPSGGGTQPMYVERVVVASRGRNPENPSDRRGGVEMKQRLEPKTDGTSNALTSVEKDNMVLEYMVINDRGFNDKEPDLREDIAPSLRAESHGNEPKVFDEYRIRKLTPRECWRLMGFSDADFGKAQAVNSNTQLYKQAGNSIVKDVLMAIFRQML